MHYKIEDGDVILPKKLITEIPDLRLRIDDLLTWYNKGDRLNHFIVGNPDSKLQKLGCKCKPDESTSKKRINRKTRTISK